MFTNDIAEFARILREEVWVGGGTPLWHGISEAIASLFGQQGRHVVVVYSDGVDTGRSGTDAGTRPRSTPSAPSIRDSTRSHPPLVH